MITQKGYLLVVSFTNRPCTEIKVYTFTRSIVPQSNVSYVSVKTNVFIVHVDVKYSQIRTCRYIR